MPEAVLAKRTWAGRVFLDAGVFLYVGPGASADVHAHHAVQLVWSREAPARLVLGDRPSEARATLVPSNVRHALDARGLIALMLVEPHSPRGAALDRLARTEVGNDLAARLGAVPFPSLAMTRGDAGRWCDLALATLAGTFVAPPMSSVSRRAVELIDRASAAPRLREVAAHLRISPTRLTHVFTREVGMPFRRFVLWSRIKRAVVAVQRGADLTRAAAAAGFSDSAHLSRTFRAMFGLSPSALLPVVELIGDRWTAPARSP